MYYIKTRGSFKTTKPVMVTGVGGVILWTEQNEDDVQHLLLINAKK